MVDSIQPGFDVDGFATQSGDYTVYAFDPSSGVYDGPQQHFIQQFTGPPAGTTIVEPPSFEAGKVTVWDSERSAWNVVEDHRGTVVWDKDTGSQYTVSSPGPIPSGMTTQAPPSSYCRWDAEKGEWVVDKDAQRRALVSQAKSAMQKASTAFSQNGWSIGVEVPDSVKAYVQSLSAIIQGKEDAGDRLPDPPAEIGG